MLLKFVQQNCPVSCGAKYVALSHSGKGKDRHVLEWNEILVKVTCYTLSVIPLMEVWLPSHIHALCSYCLMATHYESPSPPTSQLGLQLIVCYLLYVFIQVLKYR